MKSSKSLMIEKLLFFILFVIPIIAISVYLAIFSFQEEIFYGLSVYFYCIFVLIILLIVMLLCFISCIEYKVNGKTVVVYNGFYHHYLAVDGEMVDEHNTLLSFSAVKLSYESAELNIKVTIPLIGKISTNVNGKIVHGRRLA